MELKEKETCKRNRIERKNYEGRVWEVFHQCELCQGRVDARDTYCRWCGRKFN